VKSGDCGSLVLLLKWIPMNEMFLTAKLLVVIALSVRVLSRGRAPSP
jgi:hypothetical protein